MQPIFITKDLQNLVTRIYGFPSNQEYKVLDDNEKQYLKEIIQKYNEALSLINSAFDEPTFSRIYVTKSSKQAFIILKNTYED